MADDPLLYEEGEKAAPEGGAKPAPKSKKKLIIIVAAVVAVLLLGGGGAAWFLLGGKKEGAHAEEAAAPEPAHGKKEGEEEKFVDVPAMLVNLRTTDGNPHFLKLHLMLVPGEKGTEEEITKKLPLVLDAYQPFLRELRPEDLSGSAAVFRIKEELMVRTHDALGEGVVEDILIQDLIQQ